MKQTRRDFLELAMALGLLPASATLKAQSPTITTLLGTGVRGTTVAGNAAGMPLNNPYGLILNAAGTELFFINNSSHRILALDMNAMTLRVIAGTGTTGSNGNGGPATEAQLAQPHEIRFDSNGDLYVAERDNQVIRRIDMRTGIITVVAGTLGVMGFAGDGGPATAAQLNRPHALSLDADDNLYISDVQNHRVRRVDAATGLITTFAGNGETGPSADLGPLSQPIFGPRSMEISPSGRIFLALREGNCVYELMPGNGQMQRIAGTGVVGYSGDGGPALEATFGATGPGGLTGPKGLCISENESTLFVADCENHVIRAIDLESGIITTVAGTGIAGDGPDGDPLQCALDRPHAIYHRGNTLFIGDSSNHKIRVVSPVA